MRLYHHPFSSCSRRVVLTISQLGISDQVEFALVELPKGEQRSPAHLQLNPNGRVPVLQDGQFVLWESHAIMLYLAESTPEQSLLPLEPRARANVTRWLFWNSHHFAPAVSVLNFERMVKPLVGAGDPDPNEVARGERLLAQFAGVLDAHLAEREWIAEGQLTLADLAVASELWSTQRSQLPVTDLHHLQRWFSRIRELEAWKRLAA
jgi:glutathione S-transferase